MMFRLSPDALHYNTMTAILIALNVVAAFALWFKPKCKWFATIQILQLLEIYPMMHASVWQWMSWDMLNAGANIAAFFCTRKLFLSRYLMILWSFAILFRYADKDCAFEMVRDSNYWVIYHLNNVILLTLLAYAFSKPILRLKEHCVQIFYRITYSPA